jgi:hypothetical protein
MSRKYWNDLTGPQLCLATILLIGVGFGIISLQAWLLGIVLSWFNVTLGFWQNFLIVFLIGMLFGSSRSSSN